MMDKQEKISIIVPVHNGQDYLAACVGSINNQENVECAWEIIVVDSGSTDHTKEVCQKLQKKHDNIKVIAREDLGVSQSRNIAIAEATGDYLMFCDADDRLQPGMLAHLYQMAKETGSDIVGCGFFIWTDEREYARGSLDRSENDPVTFSGAEYISVGILTDDTRCWGKLYRRSCVGDSRFAEDLTIGEDMLFLLEVTQKAEKVTVSKRQGYAYFQNPKGAMLRPFQESYMDQITCWLRMSEQIQQIRPDLESRTTAHLIRAILLTVGKIAVLSPEKRKRFRPQIDQCRQQLRPALKVPGVFAQMERGHRFKARLFSFSPGLYVRSYNIWKK
ncbi:MAG: glycosyltransferase, partial [Lachnospiraceae bacterium]|jgi:hypothetical protein|nr:glycosyltransferase [Lachnospiraceae bacterium]